MSSGGSGVALPLAQMVSGIIEGANYDPSADLSRQNALKVADDLKRRGDRDTVLRQQTQVFNDPTVSLGDIASSVLAYGGGDPEEAAKVALLANASRGPGEGANMDDHLASLAPMEIAAGRSSNSTFPASTYGTRHKQEKVMVGGVPRLMDAQDITDEAPVLNMGEQQGMMLGDLAASMSRPEKLAAVNAEPMQQTPYTVRDLGTGAVSVTNSTGAMGPNRAIVNATGTSRDLGLPTAVRGDLIKSNLALDNFRNLIGMARGIATQDPTLFGATGEVRRFGQGVSEQIKNIGMMVGSNKSDLDGVFQDVLADAASKGIAIPGIGGYDPNLNDIVKLSVLLRYAGASALAGQENRSVSDTDIKQFAAITGDPSSVLSSQQGYLSGLDLMENIANRMGNTNAATMAPGGGLGATAASAASPGATPSPAAPPQGAQKAPDGNFYVPDPNRPGKYLLWTP